MAGLGVANVGGMPMMRPDMHGDAKTMLNTCIHNYFMSENQPGMAKALLDSPLQVNHERLKSCLLYTSPSPRDGLLSRMPSSA